MAPGLSGRQTGTIPKNKPKNSGSQSQRQSREQCIELSSLDWEHMSDLGKKKFAFNKSCMLSEAEANSVGSGLGKFRSSTANSQTENAVDNPQNGLTNRIKPSDRKQVVSKLSQIQSYLQQSADLMNAIKSSDSESNNVEIDEELLSRKSEESKKKLETLQKKKQDLLKLQEKAKQQLQEAQAEHSRLIARASCLNQELSLSKSFDLSDQQLNQRLKTVHHIHNTRSQVSENNNENHMVRKIEGGDHVSNGEQCSQENFDTERTFQLVANKMEELNAMKAQLGEIQKIMSSINAVHNGETTRRSLDSSDELKSLTISNFPNSSFSEGETAADEPNSNLMKLEQAKCKLNHLTQLLDIVQTTQNATGLSPPYLQLVSNLVNDERGSSTPSPSFSGSATSLRKNQDEISIETMQAMTRELEETTAAMKEERDKLEAARHELQMMARKLPLNKCRGENVFRNGESECEPNCSKPAIPDSDFRDVLNGSAARDEEEPNGNDGGSYQCNKFFSRNARQNGTWNGSNFSSQDRQSKRESVPRDSNVSSRSGARNSVRDSRWSPSPSSTTCSNERTNPLAQTQTQLEMSANLCETALSAESGIPPYEISFQGMFNQHQLLTRTVAQCSQLLWIQQKQIIELRNAFMLQNGMYPNFNLQSMISNQPQLNFPVVNNTPYSGFTNGTNFPNGNQFVPVPVQNLPGQNVKSNGRETQGGSICSGIREFSDQFSLRGDGHQGPHNFVISPSSLECDVRFGNFNNLPASNQNQNATSGSTSCRLPNGLNCPGPEDSGALNNQVPPGNRANNYWDNFRSYSRQNLLSNTKSNEDTETTRRALSTSGQDRQTRDVPPPSQNNHQSGHCQQSAGVSHVNSDSTSNSADQFLLSLGQQNLQQSSPRGHVLSQVRGGGETQRTSAKNETRNQDNQECRISGRKNDSSGFGGARTRTNPEGCTENKRSTRNDATQIGHNRNGANLNGSRNLSRDRDNEEVARGINKMRLDRAGCRKGEGFDNLNNRDYYNASLWDKISSEVSNFIRSNEARPHFLIQLFREMQHVTTDNLRQKTLESIQETVSANNLSERQSNGIGGNVNLIENRNNDRERRSNLNRNQIEEDPSRIDELFCQLRENQNTIRENIGMSSFVLGGNNLENPNISNIRDLINSRNNLESEGLRDLRTYFEANLCNFGDNHSSLENPNVSNIRENLGRRDAGFTGIYENVNPKNVFPSAYGNGREPRRRNRDSSGIISGSGSPTFATFDVSNSSANEFLMGNESAGNGNRSEVESFEGAVGGRGHYLQENGILGSRYLITDGRDGSINSRQFLPNGNDSGIDINFNNEERKRSFPESEISASDGGVKPKENGAVNDSANPNSFATANWQQNSGRENSFNSSSFVSISENSFFNSRTLQQSDNGDLAEADQSRNEEASGAESDSGFINSQRALEPEIGYDPNQGSHHHHHRHHHQHHQQSSDVNFSNQNVPESERNFAEASGNDCDSTGATGSEENVVFSSLPSEPEGCYRRTGDAFRTLASFERIYGEKNPERNSGTAKNCKREETPDSEKPEAKKSESGDCGSGGCSGTKNASNLENSCGNLDASGSNDFGNENSAPMNSSLNSLVEESVESPDRGESAIFMGSDWGESAIFTVPDRGESAIFPGPVHNSTAEMNEGSVFPEAVSDWECESGLDQVPTRLKITGLSIFTYDSESSEF